MQGLNVKLSYSSSEHHSSNYAERSVKVVKGFMKRSVEWPICLLEYLMTHKTPRGGQFTSKINAKKNCQGSTTCQATGI